MLHCFHSYTLVTMASHCLHLSLFSRLLSCVYTQCFLCSLSGVVQFGCTVWVVFSFVQPVLDCICFCLRHPLRGFSIILLINCYTALGSSSPSFLKHLSLHAVVMHLGLHFTSNIIHLYGSINISSCLKYTP